MPTVVLGSGIIGLSTAYFLSLPPGHLNGPPPPSCRAPEIHLVDPSPDLFHITASGLAGGFLAKDWFAPPVAPLGAFSFDLHRKLADAAGGKAKWGWCETEGWTLDFAMEAGNHVDLNWLMSGSSRATLLAEQSLIHEEAGSHPKWVRAGASAFHPITDRQSTAQVDPMRLCEFLLSECLARGVKLHSPARATQILPDSKIRIEYLSTASPSHPHPHSQTEAKTLDIDCDTLILTAGAWTPAVYSTLFPKARHVPRVNPLAGYSILVKTPHWAPIDPANDGENARVCHAVFTSDATAGFSPEVFARAGGEVWFGGLNAKGLALPDVPTPIRLPSPASSSTTPTDAEKAIETLKDIARKVCKSPRRRIASSSSTSSGDSTSSTSTPAPELEITRTSLCFRPVSPTGRPIIARVSPSDLGFTAPAELRVFVGTAHGPWGISLSLGTGWVLGQMVRGEATSVDVRALGRWE